MQLAPVLADDVARVAALARYEIFDTAAEVAFDDIALLAAQICGTPIALVSLVGADRVFFKARVGFDAANSPRELSFCAHAIYSDGVMLVQDPREDERFVDHPFCLGPTGVGFYAGEPLVSPEGHPLGTLCVIDHKPRTLSAAQLSALAALSRQVMAQLALRRQAADLRTSRVARGFVRDMLRAEGGPIARDAVTRRALGRKLALAGEGDLAARLLIFNDLGAGKLTLASVSPRGRVVLMGKDLIERGLASREPSCWLALGYVEGALAAVHGSEVLGSETRCQGQGHEHCEFHVRATTAERPAP